MTTSLGRDELWREPSCSAAQVGGWDDSRSALQLAALALALVVRFSSHQSGNYQLASRTLLQLIGLL